MEKQIVLKQRLYRELQEAGLIVFGGALITLGSFVRIPMYPVPFTLQTLAIFILGLTQPPRRAAGAAVCYLLWATLGLPVLGGTINPYWLTGKCGGYLIAFPIAAFLISWLRKKPIVALLCGCAVIFTLGWVWLSCFFGPKLAWMQGVVIFLPSAGLKIMLALALASVRWRKA
jgi:biotin transport system substrate-specific component